MSNAEFSWPIYTGRNPVISSALANTPCATLGAQGVLDQLNATLGTAHTLTPSLSSVLEDVITKNYDFGAAYGRLRQMQLSSCSTLQDGLSRLEEKDRELRRVALVDERIIRPELPPRRVWDLYSNRVVPWWSTGMHQDWQDREDREKRERRHHWRPNWRDQRIPAEWPQPISHAWVDKKDRVNIQTPINGFEWPVPIPNDANLDLIRIEMLNLGAEYAWLDVLCLRQEGGTREDLRAEEWKLDVPTIGQVYRNIQAQTQVVWYLSGLGRPLSLKAGDLDSDRCWFRRAWTLQEVGKTMIIAGDTPDGPMHAKPIDEDGNYEEEILTRFHKDLQSTEIYWPLFRALATMQKRVSTNPVDKIAGLSFCLLSDEKSAYSESQSLEDAWNALVNKMNRFSRCQLLFLYPEPGTAGKKWRPSWEQAMTTALPAVDSMRITVAVGWDDKTDADQCYAHCIERGFVRGLSVGGAEGVDRHGELTVADSNGTNHTIKIVATHQYPIPEDMYALLHMPIDPDVKDQYWVVGRRLPEQRFEKLSVFEITDWDELGKLQSLSVVEYVGVVTLK
ncbi:hypothetical protein EDD85DRAFT_114125 [Armillaria nabsnona]|nr:hypothetical protein EDD85DRAFT_114125 [Armillaria nabsnona]